MVDLLIVLTYIVVALLVAAVAISLIIIAYQLRSVLFVLGTVNVGIQAIARRVEPVASALARVNANLGAARNGLANALERRASRQTAPRETEEIG